MEKNRQIIVSSFLILFLELLLIRLISTEIRIFAYLSNFILLAALIGSGLGMMLRKKIAVYKVVYWLFGIVLIVSIEYIIRLPKLEFRLFKGITELLVPLSEAYIWGKVYTFSKTGIIIGLGLMFGLLGAVAWTFMPLGNYLGRLLNTHPKPLKAYSLNIAASILGMWFFQLLSMFQLSPVLGLVFAQVILLLLVKDKAKRSIVLIVLLVTLSYVMPKKAYQPYEQPVDFWSPYQKLTLSYLIKEEAYQAGGWFLEVNNQAYMGLLDLSDEKRMSASAYLIKEKYQEYPEDVKFIDQYVLPYEFVGESEKVLIIGVGGGNDVAAAVRQNVKRIDAVEIDPMIAELGRKYHPENPYLSKAVNLIIDDGRAYMGRTKSKYDLVISGLADSHTLSTSLTNMRLDDYLYTEESFARMYELLKDDGVAVISFEVTRPWIGAKINQSLQKTFKQNPLIFEVRSDSAFGWGGVFFVVSKDPQVLVDVLEEKPELASFIDRNRRDYPQKVKTLTDDWPYLYLDKPRIPMLHIIVGGLVFLAVWYFNRKTNKGFKLIPSFFLLGAGFLLFEFQNISKSSLIFGNTWINNLLVITAFLGLNLLSNYLVYKNKVSIGFAYVGLMLSLAVQLALPLSVYNLLDKPVRLIVAPLIMSLPVLFSGIIFASLFRATANKARAFASNLLGMAAGGLLESLSFVVGVHAVLYLTIMIYLASWLAIRGIGNRRAEFKIAG